MTKWNAGTLAQLRAFKAIYEEMSVVSAAQSLGLTQSAVSKQLSHLRARFGDELFVRTVDGMLPTPQAEAIEIRVSRILSEIDALEGQPRRQPRDFTGTFRLMATDEILERLLPGLDKLLTRDAPRMRLTTVPLSADYGARDLEIGQVNLVIAVNWHAPDHLRQRLLSRDNFVCVMHKEHVLAGMELTPESYCQSTHVVVAPLGHEDSMIDHLLEDRKLARKVVRSVASFSLLTPDLLGSDRIVTLPAAVAERLLTDKQLVSCKPPFDLPSIDYFALWHPRFHREERVAWMLDAVQKCLAPPSRMR